MGRHYFVQKATRITSKVRAHSNSKYEIMSLNGSGWFFRIFGPWWESMVNAFFLALLTKHKSLWVPEWVRQKKGRYTSNKIEGVHLASTWKRMWCVALCSSTLVENRQFFGWYSCVATDEPCKPKGGKKVFPRKEIHCNSVFLGEAFGCSSVV